MSLSMAHANVDNMDLPTKKTDRSNGCISNLFLTKMHLSNFCLAARCATPDISACYRWQCLHPDAVDKGEFYSFIYEKAFLQGKHE